MSLFGVNTLRDAQRAVLPDLARLRAADRLPDGRWAARYESLDIIRGLAAIGIVLHHVGAVDFGLSTGRVTIFFLISGYCVCASAESCARRGIGAWEFLRRRAHRIYPPYLLAILLWTVANGIKWVRGGEGGGGGNEFARHSALDWVQNLSLTQWLTMLFHPQPHPGFNPTLFVRSYWSLCYEEQFYFVVTAMFGIALAFKRTRIWAMLTLPIPLAVAWGMEFPTTVYGVFWEFWISFALGGLVFYRLSSFTSPARRWAVDFLILGVIVFSMIGWYMDDRVVGALRNKWTEWAIASVGALVLVAIRPADRFAAGSMLLFPLRFVGKIAYSLYLIHEINMGVIRGAVQFILPSSLETPANTVPTGVALALHIVLHVALASVFWLFCELPFWNKRIDGTPSSAPPPSGFTGSAG